METRPLGRTGADVSVIGLGTWQLGGDWGDVDDDAAADVLDAALDAGVTLLDTADVYGDGRSEVRIRQALAPRSDRPFVATKAGRRADPFDAGQYTPENLRAWIDRSRRNLGVETLDLVQLHCPPPATYEDDRVYDTLDALVEDGAIAAYGVSVETVAEGLRALERPGVQTVQVILNVFRRKPLEELLPAAAKARGRRPRPRAAGQRPAHRQVRPSRRRSRADDHRNFNRNGEAFDVGETFAGVPYEVGVAAAREFVELAGTACPAPFALRWVIQQPGVTCRHPRRPQRRAGARQRRRRRPPAPDRSRARRPRAAVRRAHPRPRARPLVTPTVL